VRPLLKQEKRLLIALAALLVLLNVPYGSYLLYPFAIVSTWVHELCHGLAALALGGGIERMQVFSDASGLALTRRPASRLAAAAVASAGYLGTSLVGAGLLALRHARWTGPVGVPAIGGLMVLTALLWVRNPFGFVAVVAIGLAFMALGSTLSSMPASSLLFFTPSSIACASRFSGGVRIRPQKTLRIAF
jgi:hypothetical protein